jgi:hypothetical protein
MPGKGHHPGRDLVCGIHVLIIVQDGMNGLIPLVCVEIIPGGIFYRRLQYGLVPGEVMPGNERGFVQKRGVRERILLV